MMLDAPLPPTLDIEADDRTPRPAETRLKIIDGDFRFTIFRNDEIGLNKVFCFKFPRRNAINAATRYIRIFEVGSNKTSTVKCCVSKIRVAEVSTIEISITEIDVIKIYII